MSEAEREYDKLHGQDAPAAGPSVQAARLNGLLKTLAKAEGAVQECVKARTELIEALEKLLSTNRAALAEDEAQLAELGSRKESVDAQKHQIELSIISGLASNDNRQAGTAGASPVPEPDRPEVEALTPPPAYDEHEFGATDNEPPKITPALPAENPAYQPAVPAPQGTFQPSSAPGIEMLSNLASQYQAVPISTNGSNKKRKLDAGDDFPDLGNDDGIDADVAEMLRRDSKGA